MVQETWSGIINESLICPQKATKLGSDCSGSDGAVNRTLTLTHPSIYSTGILVTVNQASLHEGTGLDFTASGNVITFLNNVWDVDKVQVVYFT